MMPTGPARPVSHTVGGCLSSPPNDPLVVEPRARFTGEVSATVSAGTVLWGCVPDIPLVREHVGREMELRQAIYEIHMLENGNLRLVAIEDPCAHRSSDFQAEWEPVP